MIVLFSLAGAATCTDDKSEALGPIANEEITSASGVVASRKHGVFWVHNDLGGPKVYAVGPKGEDKGAFDISFATAEDWEDIALQTGKDGDWLLFADIGDDRRKRSQVVIYRIPEPTPGGDAEPAERMVVRYPEGAQNAETLIVEGSELYIVTKVEDGPSALYHLGPFVADNVTAKLVGPVKITEGIKRITGGDLVDGRVVLRTYTHFHIFEGGAKGLLGATRCSQPYKDEQQGEAITFTEGGVITVSAGEEQKLRKLPLAFATTKPPEKEPAPTE